MLAAISFVTNPRDLRQFQRPEYRESVTESLYKGVAKYETGLGRCGSRWSGRRSLEATQIASTCVFFECAYDL